MSRINTGKAFPQEAWFFKDLSGLHISTLCSVAFQSTQKINHKNPANSYH
jgi:hypothetical protein